MAGLLFEPFREKVGGNLRLATCGAGSLPKYLDELFNAIGITLVNAYGMTECAPGVLSRQVDRNTFGSTGLPFDNTEVEVRLEDGKPAPVGKKGVLFVRGPQVTSGYYKNPEATAALLSPDGWLNTGDLAVQSENGEYVIVGRAKDTIVLMGGENVEPEPIEEKLKESVYIDHAVVLGQDQKQISAIVAINEEELMKLAAELKLSMSDILVKGNQLDRARRDLQFPSQGSELAHNEGGRLQALRADNEDIPHPERLLRGQGADPDLEGQAQIRRGALSDISWTSTSRAETRTPNRDGWRRALRFGESSGVRRSA